MKIETKIPAPEPVSAYILKPGQVGLLLAHGDYRADMTVVRNWSGLASLDGNFFWNERVLEDHTTQFMVQVYPEGTVLTLTL